MSGYPCLECGRQFGDGEACQHCQTAPREPERIRPDAQQAAKDAIAAARQLLAEKRKERK